MKYLCTGKVGTRFNTCRVGGSDLGVTSSYVKEPCMNAIVVVMLWSLSCATIVVIRHGRTHAMVVDV